MKKPWLMLIGASAISILAFSLIGREVRDGSVSPATTGFAVVELFTSEGCSSCPPADEAVARIAKENPEHVFVLGFHVDYWDRLGWKDVFSNPDYTKRQQQYGELFKLNSIYTPQVIVNGRSQFVGSDETRLRSEINSDLQSAAAVSITLRAKTTDNKRVSVSFGISPAADGDLHIALIQLSARTAVRKGENGGKILQHVDIVRDFVTVACHHRAEGSASLSIPSGLSANDCKLVAFLQDPGNGRLSGAAATGIK
jgi:hypothetical protein